jgi:hypothetical protein
VPSAEVTTDTRAPAWAGAAAIDVAPGGVVATDVAPADVAPAGVAATGGWDGGGRDGAGREAGGPGVPHPQQGWRLVVAAQRLSR